MNETFRYHITRSLTTPFNLFAWPFFSFDDSIGLCGKLKNPICKLVDRKHPTIDDWGFNFECVWAFGSTIACNIHIIIMRAKNCELASNLSLQSVFNCEWIVMWRWYFRSYALIKWNRPNAINKSMEKIELRGVQCAMLCILHIQTKIYSESCTSRFQSDGFDRPMWCWQYEMICRLWPILRDQISGVCRCFHLKQSIVMGKVDSLKKNCTKIITSEKETR